LKEITFVFVYSEVDDESNRICLQAPTKKLAGGELE
jgi:hypothetical protein